MSIISAEQRLVDKRELRQLVLYSPSHIRRLELLGTFPRRIRLGPCRVAWLLAEVLDWIKCRREGRAWKPQESLGGNGHAQH